MRVGMSLMDSMFVCITEREWVCMCIKAFGDNMSSLAHAVLTFSHLIYIYIYIYILRHTHTVLISFTSFPRHYLG